MTTRTRLRSRRWWIILDFVVTHSPATQPDPTPTAAEADSKTTLHGHLDTWAAGISVTAIWLATLGAALLSPDLVTGSQQEYFPLVGALDWLSSAVATGYVLMAGRAADSDGRTRSGAGSFVLGVTAVWATTALASTFAPPIVTGTDPTQISLVAMLVPLAAMALTGFICLHAAAAVPHARRRRVDESIGLCRTPIGYGSPWVPAPQSIGFPRRRDTSRRMSGRASLLRSCALDRQTEARLNGGETMRRTIFAAALVLVSFGSTFLWFMPSVHGLDQEPTGGVWSVIQLSVVLTALLFAAAGWAVYKSLPWWRVSAITGAVLGIAVSLLWWVAVSSLPGVTSPASNIAVHVAGSLAVLAALLVPGISRRVDQALGVAAPKKAGPR